MSERRERWAQALMDRLIRRMHAAQDALTPPAPPAARPQAPRPVVARPPPAASAESDAVPAAEQLLANGDLDGVKALLEPHADQAGLAATRLILARVRIADGEFDAALELLRRAESEHPDDQSLWACLADVLHLLRRDAEALPYRRRLVFLNAGVTPQACVDFARAVGEAATDGASASPSEIKFVSKKLMQAPDATASMHLAMAQILYGVSGQAERARQHFQKAAPVGDQEVDVKAQWVSLRDWCAHTDAPLHRVAEWGTPGRRPLLAELRDVCVFPSFQWIPVVDGGRFVLSDFVMHRMRCRDEEPLTPLLMMNAGAAELRMPRELLAIDEPVVLLGGMPQYYHHSIEFLTALAIVEMLGIGRDLRLAVNHDLADFQLQQFALLGYPEERLIRVRADTPVRFSHAFVPSRLVLGGRWIDPLVPHWHRQRLGAGLVGGEAPTRKLYVSRRNVERRRIGNEAEVTATLQARGYEIVVPEELGIPEQIALFSQASHVVAPTGAALTNMMYAPAGAAITVLYNRHLVRGGGDLYFDALAEACGHRFQSLECSPARVDPGRRVIDADLQVDLASLEALLD